MITISFEPGDDSFELLVDRLDEIKESDWNCPATCIALRTRNGGFRVVKPLGVIGRSYIGEENV